MYKKVCTLCLHTVQVYHALEAYSYGSLDFWRIFGPHENLRRARAQLAYLTHLVEKKNQHAGTRKKDHGTWLRKTFTSNSHSWETGLSSSCWRHQWCAEYYSRGTDWLIIQYCLNSFPLRGPWFATDDLFLQCFQTQKFAAAAYHKGRTEPACLCG